MTNATFSVIYDWAGSDNSPGTSTDITSLGPPTLKFKNADDATIDSNNKLTVPASTTIYSFFKQIFLKCTANADVHTINNVKIYSDGGNSLGTGVDCNVALQFPVHNSTPTTTGYDLATAAHMTTDHTDVTTEASIFNYASGTGLAVSISESGSVINATNETTNYVVLQISVASTASPGVTTTETGTWSYDEA